MRKLFLTLAVCIASAAMAQDAKMNKFIDKLMDRMTLEEKLGQLNLLPAGEIQTGDPMQLPIGKMIASGELGSVLNVKGQENIRKIQELSQKSRLKIPVMVGLDVIHGYETIFPTPLGLACTWDMQSIERAASVAALEATADGISWNYSPMVDIALDARWGRIAESGGEDTYLGSLIAAAYVRGYQGNYSDRNLMACLKHFALYGASEAGKDYTAVDMSDVRMFNRYLPPYRAAVEAGVGSVMTSFNTIGGVHATINKWLITDVLRHDWGFQGFVVTDYASIEELKTHGQAANVKDGGIMALQAGTDMDMCSNSFNPTLRESLAEGRVTMDEINTAVRRVLEAKYIQGLFDDPYRFCKPKRLQTDLYNAESRAAAREITAQSFVLLKNQDNLLPLAKKGKIALIGPLADDRQNIMGTWAVAGTPEKYTTIREALTKNLQGQAEVLYAQGSNVYYDEELQRKVEFGLNIPRGDDKQLLAEALEVARQSDVILCCLGEVANMAGESSTRCYLDIPDCQQDLLKELCRLGKPVVLLNFAGRPTSLTWESKHVPAIMNVWSGSEVGDALYDVLFGDREPGGRLAATMPRSVGQEPLYYSHLSGGRPRPDGWQFSKYGSTYVDEVNGPLYHFGYGLTYSTFEYSDITLSSPELTTDGEVTATVTVTNTGERTASDVPQLYIRDLVCSIARPVKELKGFERVTLQPGQSAHVSFRITEEMLRFYNKELRYVSEPGDFDIMVGPDCSRVKTAKLTLR